MVHRDIKPENILLHEGEAMLADFGIALAVREAGGNRLTETGLSLGTPQYMSPEQATGDRVLDARSDVYSLAAVLYEMLAGEPPVTGPTAQAMIAKLMTERPIHLRVVRPSVPEAWTPPWRRRSTRRRPTGSRARATSPARSTSHTAPARRRRVVLPAGGRAAAWCRLGVALLALAAAGAFVATGRLAAAARRVALRDRTQLTFSGTVFASAVSADGKQLAYVTHNCGATGCTYRGSAGRRRHRDPPGARRSHGSLRPRVESGPPQPDLPRHHRSRWGLYLLGASAGPRAT